jgi:hypothetical protein
MRWVILGIVLLVLLLFMYLVLPDLRRYLRIRAM